MAGKIRNDGHAEATTVREAPQPLGWAEFFRQLADGTYRDPRHLG